MSKLLPRLPERGWDAVIERSLHSPAAGRLASGRMDMRVANTVGGIGIGVLMDAQVTGQNILANAKKDFTGIICQMSAGQGADVLYVSALIFVPGSIQFMGARTADAIRLAAHELIGHLRRNRIMAHIMHFSIDNRVMTSSLEFSVDLAALHGNMPGYLTSYCPDLFPGLVCGSLTEDVVTFMIFEGGKVMALGVNDVERIKDKFWEIYAIAQQHKIDQNVSKQSNKSHDRSIRKASRGRPSNKEGDLVAKVMKDFISRHREQMQDTAFSMRIQEVVDAEIRKAIATAREKKQHDAALKANGELYFEPLPEELPATAKRPADAEAPVPKPKRAYKARAKRAAKNKPPPSPTASYAGSDMDEPIIYAMTSAYDLVD